MDGAGDLRDQPRGSETKPSEQRVSTGGPEPVDTRKRREHEERPSQDGESRGHARCARLVGAGSGGSAGPRRRWFAHAPPRRLLRKPPERGPERP